MFTFNCYIPINSTNCNNYCINKNYIWDIHIENFDCKITIEISNTKHINILSLKRHSSIKMKSIYYIAFIFLFCQNCFHKPVQQLVTLKSCIQVWIILQLNLQKELNESHLQNLHLQMLLFQVLKMYKWGWCISWSTSWLNSRKCELYSIYMWW